MSEIMETLRQHSMAYVGLLRRWSLQKWLLAFLWAICIVLIFHRWNPTRSVKTLLGYPSSREHSAFELLSEKSFNFNAPWTMDTVTTYSERRADWNAPSCKTPPRFVKFDYESLAGKFGCDDIREMMQDKKPIGKGFWRDVFRVTHQGEKYAVKRVLPAKRDTTKAIRRHRNEALISTELAAEPNIARYYGICRSTVVNEYCTKTLANVLYDPEVTVSFPTAMKWVLGIARAIAALHLKMRHTRIVHADLQPRQVLLCNDGVRVGDYNRARIMERDEEGAFCSFSIPNSEGRWRAPEEFQRTAQLNEKLDIYSTGVMFFAIFKRKLPFVWLGWGEVVKRMKAGDIPKLRFDPDWNEDIRSIIEDCTREKWSERPNAAQLLERVTILHDEIVAKCPDEVEGAEVCPGGPTLLPPADK